MNGVSLARLHVLRATYVLVAGGLLATIWPLLLTPPPDLEHMRGVVWSLLGAVGLLAIWGVRYPLQMLPVLLFELVWKSIWIVAIALPQRMAGTLSPAESTTWFECVFGVIVCVVAIPWRYVLDHYVRKAGDPWRKHS